MIKLTIKQYATNNQLSTQAVYNLIKAGKLEAYEQNGTKYILIDDNAHYKELASNLQQTCNSLKREIELQNKLIETLQFQQSLFTRLLPNIENNDTLEVANQLQQTCNKKKKKKNKKKRYNT